MSQTIVQVDAFTDKAFAGNPATVCVMQKAAEEGWMQSVAREMNLSETAYLYRDGDHYNLRWFTPRAEVELCGHATLASAHVLWEEGLAKPDEMIKFQTRSGELTAKRADGWIMLDFPARIVEEEQLSASLSVALGCIPVASGHTNNNDMFVQVESEEIVRGLDPDFAQLKKIGVRGVIVTAEGTGEFDFVSRFFAPGVGIDEDPVTGAAHCVLTPYWAKKLGKEDMLAYQASERGGVVRVKLNGDRVQLLGQAVTVMKGTLSC